MTEILHITSQSMHHIHTMTTEQVPEFIAHQQKNRSLTALIRKLNATLLSGPTDERDAARIALEKLGFVDV